MLFCHGNRLLMTFSTLGFVRSYVAPRASSAFHGSGRTATSTIERLSKLVGKDDCPGNTNKIVISAGFERAPHTATTGMASRHARRAITEDEDDWDTWEFGSWKTGTHEENQAEAAARAAVPAVLPDLMGGGAGVAEHSDDDLERAVQVLKGYLTEERLTRMQHVLDQRTRSTVMVFENPANPNNVWACLRTLDSFGIQHAHIVSDPSTYSKKARLKTMVTAMGSQKWLTLHGHDNPEEAVGKLKAQGYQVVASDLSSTAVPIGEVDWSIPTAIVLGNEERGISDTMRQLADQTFVIPMRGFVRSFNMSVACSVILSHLSAVRALRHGDLTEVERRRIIATWCMQTVKGSDAILRREGIDIPPEVYGPKGDRAQTIAGYHVR